MLERDLKLASALLKRNPTIENPFEVSSVELRRLLEKLQHCVDDSKILSEKDLDRIRVRWAILLGLW
jgi:Fe-S-cluster formation regulator IscX/YfhJ